MKNNPFRVGIGAGSSSVKNVSEGSLVIHVIDRARNAEVLRSRVSRELGKGNVEPKIIQSAVAEVFSDFPAHSSAP